MSNQMNMGAKWVRAALQVNPYGYEGKVTPSNVFDTEHDYNTALLDACEELKIGMIAVTDHWCVQSGEGLLKAAKTRGICALPGFEANSSEGVHLLVIFEEGTPLSDIDAAIGKCGVTPGCNNGELGESYADIMSAMTKRGALVIPAHANVAKGGMLTSRSGRPLESMVQHPHLHAIAISPDQEPGTDQNLILEGTKPYLRKHPLAEIHSDDISLPQHLEKQGASSWFKVSNRSLESLKLAVRTPETRVSLVDPLQNVKSRLVSIKWIGGYFDQVEIPICRDLTALIGGRGAGKSTLIESIRFAVGAEFLGTRTKNDSESIVKNVLQSGTVVELKVQMSGQQNGLYTVSRTVSEMPIVLDPSGDKTELQPEDVLGDIEIYGQHELAELAGSPADIAKMVMRFNGGGNEYNLSDIQQEIDANRRELKLNEDSLKALDEQLSDISRLEAQEQKYASNKVADRLTDKRRIDAEGAVFSEASDRFKRVIEDRAIGELENQIDSLGADLIRVPNSPHEDLQDSVFQILQSAAREISDLRQSIHEKLQYGLSQVEQARDQWREKVQPEVEQHAAVLRSLNDEGLEPDKYIETSRQLIGLRARLPERERLVKNIETLTEARKTLLDRLDSARRQEEDRFKEAIRHANRSNNGVVIVKPIRDASRANFHDLIARYVKGRKDKISPIINDSDFSPSFFAEHIGSGVESLKKIGISPAQSEALANAGEGLVRDLEEAYIPMTAGVSLKVPSRKGKQELKSIDALSKGQRATALLLLLLGASDSPLIIDQPEDDLDNRFVFDGVVSHLRSMKGKRQVVLSTHNANVPVLGDAEMIVVLEGDGRKGRVAESGLGSLDDKEIRSYAEDILEGGSTAFKARHHLYGF